MSRFLLLARSNMRREGTQTAILVVLLVVGAFVLNLLLMLTTDYHENFDRWHEALHAEDVLIAISAPEAVVENDLNTIMNERGDVTEYSLEEGLIMTVEFPYNGGSMVSPMVVLPYTEGTSRSIGRVEMTSGQSPDSSGMYFPLIYESEDLLTGQQGEIKINGSARTVYVNGFFNSIMAGSHNCGIILLLAGDDLYSELSKEAGPVTLLSARIDDAGNSTDVRGELLKSVRDLWPDTVVQGTDYMRTRQVRYIMQSITTAILAGAVCFVLIVAMTVSASNVAMHVQQRMPELGMLECLGYTGRNLVWALVSQYALIALPASAAGAALSYTVFPRISEIMTAQTGIPYDVHFLPGPFATSCAICVGVISLSAFMSARRIRTLQPVTAFRSGVETHNFRRNPMPLSRSRLPLNAAVALKNCASAPRRNVTICVTMAALTLLIVFASVMVKNIIIDVTPMLDLVGIERAEVMLTFAAEDESEVKSALDTDERVQKYYLYHQESDVAEIDGPGLAGIVIDEPTDLQNQTILYEGRLPLYDNEAALGALHAEERGLKIGDMIALGPEDKSAPYLIVGLTQGTNYLGDEIIVLRDGYERMRELKTITYYVDINPKTSAQKFLTDIEGRLPGIVESSADISSVIDATMKVYVYAMQMVVYVLAALTVILTVLVMVLLTRTTLNTRLHELGILKALGFTTANLVGQTVMSFALPLVLSETCGLIVWSMLGNKLAGLFLRSMGTMRVDLEVPAGPIAVVGAALLIFALAVVALMALRIRNISAVQLMADE